jgi:AhpD family alkylhydroperoxidase
MEWNERIKELVAVGASITANCQPCLQYHVDKALESGATPQEIEAAIGVGNQVRKGASAKMNDFSTGLKETILATAGEKKSACCG